MSNQIFICICSCIPALASPLALSQIIMRQILIGAPIPGAKKVGGHCSKAISLPMTTYYYHSGENDNHPYWVQRLPMSSMSLHPGTPFGLHLI